MGGGVAVHLEGSARGRAPRGGAAVPKAIATVPILYWPEGVPRHTGIPPYSVCDLALDRWARRSPQRVAVDACDGRLTYAELREAVHGGGAGTGIVEVLRRLSAVEDPRAPALPLPTPDGLTALHSNRSLLSMALSTAVFLQARTDEAWLATRPLHTWEGLVSLLVPLCLGATAILVDPGAVTEGIERGAAYALIPFDDGPALQDRHSVEVIRSNLRCLLLSVGSVFDWVQRRDLRHRLDVPVLTVYGRAETGPVLASHPSWCVDEAVGIPVTNVLVRPADPRTGRRIPMRWELLDQALVAVRSPHNLVAYEGRTDPLVDGFFVTDARAASDANGMFYLLGGSG